MRKKAQITMESLLLYGAAILVVLLAIAALTYFGVLDLGRFLPEKCDLSGTGIFTCEEWMVTADAAADGDNILVVVRNKGTKTVTIKEIRFDTGSTGYVDSDYCEEDITDIDVLPGKLSEAIEITDCDIKLDPGDRIKGQVTLTHMYSDGVLDMTTTGEMSAKITPE